MKIQTSKHQLILLSAMITSAFSFGQIESKYAIGVNVGAFIYQGDLTPSPLGSFKTPAAVIGFTGSRNLTNVLSARLDLNFGQLKGDDAKYKTPAYRKQRAFTFKTPVTEIIGNVVYHPVGRDRKLSPYVFGGVGLSFINIQRDYSRFNAAFFETEPAVTDGLTKDIAHALPKRIPVVPVGVGLQYHLSDKLSLHSEASYRIMSTDYLDGFSQAVNPALKDHYYKYSIGISFSLDGKSKYDCPTAK